MSEEKQKLIEEMVENLKQMDHESLVIMKSGAEMLRARDELDRKKEEKEQIAV